METFGSSRIAGIGAYLPEQRVTTDELMHEVNSQRFGIPENYISRHIGIVEKRVSDPDLIPSDLAVLASEVALRDAGVSADEIDLIIYTGITRDFEEPSTAHNVQNKLGASNAVCLDVSNACLGFMTGLWTGDLFFKSEKARNILVCTGEIQSNTVKQFIKALKTTTDKDFFKNVFGVFTVGDAGSAVVLQRRQANNGLHWMKFISKGSLSHLCTYEKREEGVKGQMLMQEISTEILSLHRRAMPITYKTLGWEPDAIDFVYAHQVGRRPHEEMMKMSKLSVEKAPSTYEMFGNLSSATIPTCMYLNRPNRGDNLLLLGAGSGISICQGGMIF